MVEFKKSNKQAVTEAEMRVVYKKISTPHKLGAVIKWEDFYTDSPTVFKKDGIIEVFRRENSPYETACFMLRGLGRKC